MVQSMILDQKSGMPEEDEPNQTSYATSTYASLWQHLQPANVK